jgi:hypothetical protein
MLQILRPMDDFEQTTYTAQVQASALHDQAALLQDMLSAAVAAANSADVPAGQPHGGVGSAPASTAHQTVEGAAGASQTEVSPVGERRVAASRARVERRGEEVTPMEEG